MARPGLACVACLALALHASAIARTVLPAQDGLKFIRAAEAIQRQGWISGIRGCDQHPLYPTLISAIEPLVGLVAEPGPDAWRLSAQLVSAAASLLTIGPLHALARRLFGTRAALLTTLLFVLLPLPMEIGHEALSDALAVFWFTLALERGVAWLETGAVRAGLACGVATGLGYWTRPEIVLIGGCILLIWLTRTLKAVDRQGGLLPGGQVAVPRVLVVAAPMLLLVSGYAFAKGTISEKLALRLSIGLPPAQAARAPDQVHEAFILPPKEEIEPASQTWAGAAFDLSWTWTRIMGALTAPLALAGALLARPSAGRSLMRLYCVVFLALLLRHTVALGYLSIRHLLTVVVVCLPWAGWRLARLMERVGGWIRPAGPWRRLALGGALALMIALGLAAQAKPSHPSRWGHWAAGQWLHERMLDHECVLDTRGWAAFVSRGRSYGPWHVRQALSDPGLRYLVIERSELESGSTRADALRRLIEPRATLAAAFPEERGGGTASVLVFRWIGGQDGEPRP